MRIKIHPCFSVGCSDSFALAFLDMLIFKEECLFGITEDLGFRIWDLGFGPDSYQ